MGTYRKRVHTTNKPGRSKGGKWEGGKVWMVWMVTVFGVDGLTVEVYRVPCTASPGGGPK